MGEKSNELPWKKEIVITLLNRSEIPTPGGELCRRIVKGTDGIKVSCYIDFLKSLTRNIHIEYKNNNNNFNTSGKCEKSITPPSPNTERSQEKRKTRSQEFRYKSHPFVTYLSFARDHGVHEEHGQQEQGDLKEASIHSAPYKAHSVCNKLEDQGLRRQK